MTKVLALSMTLSFRLVEGLPGHGSLSTDVRPSSKRLNHSFMREMLMASSPKACWISLMIFTSVSPSFWQILMQYRCSSSSFRNNWQSNERSLHFLTHRPAVTDWRFLRAGKNSGMYMTVPYTTPLKDVSQSSFVYAGKIKVRYFLNRGLSMTHRLPNRYRGNAYTNRYSSNSLINMISTVTNNRNNTWIVVSGDCTWVRLTTSTDVRWKDASVSQTIQVS
jgi:hypothetical protein